MLWMGLWWGWFESEGSFLGVWEFMGKGRMRVKKASVRGGFKQRKRFGEDESHRDDCVINANKSLKLIIITIFFFAREN